MKGSVRCVSRRDGHNVSLHTTQFGFGSSGVREAAGPHFSLPWEGFLRVGDIAHVRHRGAQTSCSGRCIHGLDGCEYDTWTPRGLPGFYTQGHRIHTKAFSLASIGRTVQEGQAQNPPPRYPTQHPHLILCATSYRVMLVWGVLREAGFEVLVGQAA